MPCWIGIVNKVVFSERFISSAGHRQPAQRRERVSGAKATAPCWSQHSFYPIAEGIRIKEMQTGIHPLQSMGAQAPVLLPGALLSSQPTPQPQIPPGTHSQTQKGHPAPEGTVPALGLDTASAVTVP